MWSSKEAMAIAIAGLLAVSSANAEEAFRLPPPVRQTAYEYDSYYRQESASPSDAPADAAGSNSCGEKNGCGEKEEKNGCGKEEEENGCGEENGCDGDDAAAADAPWSMMELFPKDGWFKKKRIVIGGWTEVGYQNKPDGAFTGNGPFLTEPNGTPANGEWLRPNLNQQYLYVERVADGTTGTDWGFRADIMYGVDGNEGQSFGNTPGRWDFLNGWDHGVYNWAMPQLYGQVALGEKLSIKVGHFYTPTGYEVVPPQGNFFFSRQIMWYNAEPFTHTGALANYKVNDKLTLVGGWVLGWDTGFDRLRGGSMALAGFAYNFSEKAVLTYFGAYGNFGWRGDGQLTGFIFSNKWTDKWTTVHQFDVLSTNNPTTFRTDGIANNSVGMENYVFYEITKKLFAGVRVEWWKADGTSYNTLTYGVNIKPSKNVLIRPEIRHLWAPGAPAGAPDTITRNISNVYGNSTVVGIDTVILY